MALVCSKVPDTSPTKSGTFFPDTWCRKAYEESARSITRPVPEGAGSMPSSTGTPSPGSGISSPGSFSGSPGTISPGIGTESPGSLGGSPGFGTGSPASGSGSSPGSERGIWCENCNARLTELKRQALKLLIPGPYSSKVRAHLLFSPLGCMNARFICTTRFCPVSLFLKGLVPSLTLALGVWHTLTWLLMKCWVRQHYPCLLCCSTAGVIVLINHKHAAICHTRIRSVAESRSKSLWDFL